MGAVSRQQRQIKEDRWARLVGRDTIRLNCGQWAVCLPLGDFLALHARPSLASRSPGIRESNLLDMSL